MEKKNNKTRCNKNLQVIQIKSFIKTNKNEAPEGDPLASLSKVNGFSTTQSFFHSQQCSLQQSRKRPVPLQGHQGRQGQEPRFVFLPRFWVSIRSDKKQPVKILGTILDLVWLKFAIMSLHCFKIHSLLKFSI